MGLKWKRKGKLSIVCVRKYYADFVALFRLFFCVPKFEYSNIENMLEDGTKKLIGLY